MYQIHKKLDDQTDQTTFPDNRSVVYMMPSQEIEEDTIDLWQLFLPLVKYKIQILLFLIVGTIIGFFIPRFYGTTIFKNSLTYKYSDITSFYLTITGNDKAPNEEELEVYKNSLFLPDRDFFSPNEIKKTIPILESYWNYPQITTGRQLSSYFKDNNLIQFEKSKYVNDGYRLTVTTDDPQNSIKALKELSLFFIQNNNSKIIRNNKLKINSLLRKKDELYAHLISSLQTINGIRYLKIENTGYYLDVNKYIYLLEENNNGIKAKKANPTSIKERNTIQIYNQLKNSPSIPDLLSLIIAQLQDLDKQIQNLDLKRSDLNATISFLEQEYLNSKDKAKQESVQYKIIKEKSRISSLSKEIGILESKKSQLKLDAIYTNNILQEAFNLRYNLQNISTETWINVSKSSDQNSTTEKKTTNEDSKNQSQHNKVIDTENVFLNISNINREIKHLHTVNFSLLNNHLTILDIVEQPTMQTTEKSLSFKFNQYEKEQKDEINPITDNTQPIVFTKKVLLFSLVIALFLAVLSVFLRVFIINLKKNESINMKQQDFISAIKFWKL